MRTVALLLVLGSSVMGCSAQAAEAAAARDPMKCERDPSCSKARASYVNCSKQCVDDPQCIDLCKEIQNGVDSAGVR